MASFQIFCLYSGPRYQVSVYRTIGSLEPHDSMGISKKIYEKKISKTILKKKMPGIQKIFKKCVYMYVCVCLYVGGPASDQGGLKKIYSYMYIYLPNEFF